jgi:hypothetical protein
VLFTALGTLFAVSLRPRFAILFQDRDEISDAIKAGLRVLEKVANINSLLQQCHQYFNKLQALAEARSAALAAADRVGPGPNETGEVRHEDVSMDQDIGVEAINARIFGEWDDFSGIADVFNDTLLPEFEADFFNF